MMTSYISCASIYYIPFHFDEIFFIFCNKSLVIPYKLYYDIRN